jgi:hypothetical protein
LKKWVTLPRADFARYSISANNFGSTQMPLSAIRFAYAFVCEGSGSTLRLLIARLRFRCGDR